MIDNDVTTSNLSFCYELNELKTIQSYNKKKVRDKFFRKSKKSSGIRCEGKFKFYKNIIEFVPDIDDEISRGNLYRDFFMPKWAISKDIVKSILFRTKNTEKMINKHEVINKNYRELVIYTYDYRVIRYRRLCSSEGKVDDKEYVRFYRELVNFIFSKERCSSNKLSKKIETYLINYECIEQNDVDNVSVSIEKYSSKDLNVKQSVDLELVDTSRKSNHEISAHLEYSNLEASKLVSLNRKDILESYEKLFAICTPQDREEFKQTDKKWLSRLSETEWMNHVQNVLYNVGVIIRDLSSSISSPKRKSNPILESDCIMKNNNNNNNYKNVTMKTDIKIYFKVMDDNNSIAFIVSTLLGICCCQSNRTIFGLLSYLYSNWIHNGVYKADRLMFSLLLDCIYQLIRVYPFHFEFTEELLIGLHDLLWNVDQINHDCIFPSQLPRNQYNESNCWTIEHVWSDFYEPEVLECLRFKLSNEKLLEASNKNANSQILFPPIIQDWNFLKAFWTKMYTRWISSIQIEGGSVSLLNHINNISLSFDTITQYPDGIYSNYPFSIMFDSVREKEGNGNGNQAGKTAGHNRSNTEDTISTDGMLDDDDEDDDKSVTLSVDMLDN